MTPRSCAATAVRTARPCKNDAIIGTWCRPHAEMKRRRGELAPALVAELEQLEGGGADVDAPPSTPPSTPPVDAPRRRPETAARRDVGPDTEPVPELESGHAADLERLDAEAADLFGDDVAGDVGAPSSSDAAGERTQPKVPETATRPGRAPIDGPWDDGDVAELLELLQERFRADGKKPMSPTEIRIGSSKGARCANFIMSKVDPNHPIGGFITWTAITCGVRYLPEIRAGVGRVAGAVAGRPPAPPRPRLVRDDAADAEPPAARPPRREDVDDAPDWTTVFGVPAKA